MPTAPRPIPGLTRRRQAFYLTVIKPTDLRRGPEDRYAFRATLGTRDEPEARIKALAIRADLETQWAAERARRRPQPAIAATAAIVTMLIAKMRAEYLEADDINKLAGRPLEHLPFLPADQRETETMEEVRDATAQHAKTLQMCLAAGNLDPFILVLMQLTADTGLPPIDWDAEPSHFIRFAQGTVKLFNDLAARTTGEIIETPEAPVVSVAAAKPTGAAMSWDDLLTDWTGAAKRTVSAKKITERAIRLFAESAGAVDIHKLDRSHAAQYRAALVAQGLKGRSIRNLLSPLVALLNLAVDSGKLKINPWIGIKVDTSDSVKRLPWRLEQLKALAAANTTRDDAGRWLLPLLLYTGCRIGELAQLELSDIREIDGEYAIEVHQIVTAGNELRTVKSAAGLRTVPVSPALVAMGFRAHCEAAAAGERFLFPKFIQAGKKRPSELAGRYFLALRRDAGIAPDPRFSAHSTRHNVRSKLAAAGENDSIIDKVIGHETTGAVKSRYTHADMPTLAAAIAKLNWDAVGMKTNH